MDLIDDFYRPVLKTVWVEDLTGSGMLSTTFNDAETPVTIGGKRLVLPTKEILREGNWDQRIAFHPLSENIARGESPVLKSLKDWISLRVTFVVSSLANDLMYAAASPALHASIGAKHGKFLKRLSEVDEHTYKSLKGILERVAPDPDRRIVNIALRHGSRSKDEEHLRSCIVSFPILDALSGEDKEIFGVKVVTANRKKKGEADKQAIKEVFEIILGEEEIRKEYSFGTLNMEAPYLHALLTSYARLATRLNSVVEQCRKALKDPDALLTDTSWTTALEEFKAMRGQVPPLSGNEGEVLAKDKAAAEPARPSFTPPSALGTQAFQRQVAAPAPEREDVPWNSGREEPAQPRLQPPRRQGGKDDLKSFLNELHGGEPDQRSRYQASGPGWDRRNNGWDGFETQNAGWGGRGNALNRPRPTARSNRRPF